MPELPEVETVRRGLAPAMDGAWIERVDIGRPDLRFPFPGHFAERVQGARISRLLRRGKYLIAPLSTGEALIMHLGMSGRFTVMAQSAGRPGKFARAQPCDEKHDHVVFHIEGREGAARIVYNDPRRFGFMDLADFATIEDCRHFKGMGPEPLGNHFSPAWLAEALRGKSAPIKSVLLDQRVVAGLGNIYVCEALFRAGISPRRRGASVAGIRSDRLYAAIFNVLTEAIQAGGSTLKDFASAQGELGYFQHGFDVYGRENDPCAKCSGPVRRFTQAGRSTFYCGRCQR